jgi:cysteine synthase A
LLDHLPLAEPALIADPTQQIVQSWTRCATVIDPTGALR